MDDYFRGLYEGARVFTDEQIQQVPGGGVLLSVLKEDTTDEEHKKALELYFEQNFGDLDPRKIEETFYSILKLTHRKIFTALRDQMIQKMASDQSMLGQLNELNKFGKEKELT